MSYELELPNEKEAWHRIWELAQRCVYLSGSERPEVQWLKGLYEEKRRRYKLSKAAMDERIYRRMYKKGPNTASQTLKIRYWRTGQHVPVNRETALAFARALELLPGEREYLITAWLDKSLSCYDAPPSKEDTRYWARRARLDGLAASYLQRRGAQPVALAKEARSFSQRGFSVLRHFYYMDALQYIRPDEQSLFWNKHIYSARYDLEFKRSLRLLGEIPRKTMLRHLLLFGLPELTSAWISRQLSFFGYLPLTPGHSMPGGERLDDLLLEILSSYEELAKENGAKKASLWFLVCCQRLDAYFSMEHKNGFRVMYFKSLD